jgi:hypothetical protein
VVLKHTEGSNSELAWKCCILGQSTLENRIIVEENKLKLKSILLDQAGDFQCHGLKCYGVCTTKT